VEIVNNAPIRGISSSYPGTALRRGSSGPNVVVIQVELNRISQNYPAIPKLNPVDGIFGSRTEAAVRKFQEIFGLEVDGVVGKATWYALVRLYTAVNQLSELRSQGQRFYSISWEYPNSPQLGSTGEKVRHLQYMLAVLAAYIPQIPSVTVDGIFGQKTLESVLSAQRYFGLPETGIVNAATWEEIYDQYSGIENISLRREDLFPSIGSNPSAARQRYSRSTTMPQFPGKDLMTGSQDPVRQEVVR
jgi:peptidoglycan hydrolase-like protein with peptidoglycan-binding domain